jgi:hypothetical protein
MAPTDGFRGAIIMRTVNVPATSPSPLPTA